MTFSYKNFSLALQVAKIIEYAVYQPQPVSICQTSEIGSGWQIEIFWFDGAIVAKLLNTDNNTIKIIAEVHANNTDAISSASELRAEIASGFSPYRPGLNLYQSPGVVNLCFEREFENGVFDGAEAIASYLLDCQNSAVKKLHSSAEAE